ncbi:MAG TPA: hypothetical protein VKZ96_19960 [Thermomicrobiales bacterium]|nr:hypothetical protein [Thermomicrobiales bacterium]
MAQTVDQRDLLNNYRSGDLHASERIVRIYQNELLRSAFLLTGSADSAIALARDAFLRFFRRLLRGDTPEDARYGLLHSLGREYLDERPADGEFGGNGLGPGAALAGTVPFQEEPQRYRVDDERSRVLTALELLERPTRLGLVLRDFNMLDEEPVCQVLDETPFTLRARLHPARSRIQDAGGASGDHSARELLVTAATAAPRPELWPVVAGPLEQLHAEEDERRQRYTYIAAGAVGLLLVLATLWLFDVFPFGGGEEGDVAAVATEAEPTPTLTPEPAPTPTMPDLASFNIPQGDVPDAMMMLLHGDRDGQGAVFEFGAFDPATATYSSYGQERAPSSFSVVSPDGHYLIGQSRPETSPGASGLLLMAYDLQTGERLWETEVPGDGLNLAITLDRIYAVTAISVNAAEPITLLEFDLATGELIAEHPDVIDAIQANVTSFNRVQLWASPDNTRLFIALEERSEDPTLMLSYTLASFSLPDLTFESASIQTDSTSERQFPADFNFFAARVTPDGRHIYDVGLDVVRFRSSRMDEDLDVGIPLGGPPPAGQPNDLRWIPSNDGRYLYVVAVNRGQGAVIDLLGRRVAWSSAIAVDPGLEPIDWGGLDPGGFSGWANLTLSPDGRYLYLAEALRGSEGGSFPAGSLILTIDLSTWTVIQRQEIDGQVFTLARAGDQLVVGRQVRSVPDGTPYQMVYLDSASGAVIGEFTGEGLPEWVTEFAALSISEMYRYSYGRAPAVAGAIPGVVETEITLPRVRVNASSATVPVGGNVEFTVRVLHPVTGRFMAEESSQTRFDLDSTIVLRVFHEDGEAEPLILVANLASPGVYRASATIPATGLWSAEVTITGADGQAWSLVAPRLFEGVPSWEATDGRHYVLRLETDPAEPRVEERVTVRAWLVDVQNGAPLPADVELVEPFPDELDATFRSVAVGATSSILRRNAEGVYEGLASFGAPGVWQATVDYARPGEGRIPVGSAAVNVVSN